MVQQQQRCCINEDVLQVSRGALVVLGFVGLGLGYHSHYGSNWMYIEKFDMCYDPDLKRRLQLRNRACPQIEPEQFFIISISISWALALFWLVADQCVDLDKPGRKIFDMISHMIGAVLQFAASIAYAISAVKLHDVEALPLDQSLRDEKFVSAALTMMLSWICVFCSALIAHLHDGSGTKFDQVPSNLSRLT